MENTQNLSPSLIIFFLLSLALCIWAIIDIFKSNFTKTAKVVWLLIVLFAPFGIFIYILIGRRLKPGREDAAVRGPEGRLSLEGAKSGGMLFGANTKWSILVTLFTVAFLSIVIYLNIVSYLGREKTGFVLLGAMTVVGIILTILQIKQGRKVR